jgi:DNA-binding transcriptional LysR family regulator
MDLELLRTFLEVNRTRHFGHAAEVLHLTQAAVSARIKQLESILGTRLFDRAGRDIRLTPEGNRLKRHADLLLAEWRKARQEVTAGGAKYQMSIGGSPRLWDVILHEWLIELRKQHPELALITHSRSPDALLRGVLDGVIDLAIMLDPPMLETLDVREVATIRLVLVSDRAGISIDEAINEAFLLVDWGLAHALELQRTYPDMPEPMTRLANARLAIRYLRDIGGSAYLPLPSVISAIRRGRLHRVQGALMF